MAVVKLTIFKSSWPTDNINDHHRGSTGRAVNKLAGLFISLGHTEVASRSCRSVLIRVSEEDQDSRKYNHPMPILAKFRGS